MVLTDFCYTETREFSSKPERVQARKRRKKNVPESKTVAPSLGYIPCRRKTGPRSSIVQNNAIPG